MSIEQLVIMSGRHCDERDSKHQSIIIHSYLAKRTWMSASLLLTSRNVSFEFLAHTSSASPKTRLTWPDVKLA